jgi:hypothetical protein
VASIAATDTRARVSTLRPDPHRRRVIETRFGRYRMAWIPLTHSPLPGFAACAVQAVPIEPLARRAVRLVLYERISPPARDDGDELAA